METTKLVENGNAAAVESGPEAAAAAAPIKEEEVTKRSIRVQCWKKIQSEKIAIHNRYIFNRITNFVDADKAAQLLAETPEFQKANKIKINLDRSQEPIKLLVIEAKKELYVAPARNSEAILARIEPPADADEETKKKVVFPSAVTEFGKELPFDTDLKLDMLVIGSVAVDKEGRHIGKGNGYVDLDYGILAHRGIVTKDTLVVTTVHDIQVHDKLPADLFRSYDVPVDIIVTPTQVIRVAKRLPRPDSIQWQLLSERRLAIVPVLKVIRAAEEKAGKAVVLKEDDTDVETNRRSARFPRTSEVRRRRLYSRRNRGDKGGAQNGAGEGKESANEGGEKRRPPRRRNRRNNNNRSKEGEEGAENNGENNGESSDAAAAGGAGGERGGRRRGGRRGQRGGEGGANKERPQRRRGGGGGAGDGGAGGDGGAAGAGDRGSRRKFGGANRICVKLTNVSQESRARDIKQSLRERQCNPSRIVMKGETCYVHYFKPEQDLEEASNQIIAALADLTIKSENNERAEYPVVVELLKTEKVEGEEGGVAGAAAADVARVETTDVTAV